MTKRKNAIALLSLFILLPSVAIAKKKEHICNICGEGNIIGDRNNAVKIPEYDGRPYSFPCSQLQQQVDDGVIDKEFCEEELLQYTLHPCGCMTPDGEFFWEYLQNTIPPNGSTGKGGGTKNAGVGGESGNEAGDASSTSDSGFGTNKNGGKPEDKTGDDNGNTSSAFSPRILASSLMALLVAFFPWFH